ncbi:MAG: hypothetical protein ACLGIR_14210 [Actinomycetes bacterium]
MIGVVVERGGGHGAAPGADYAARRAVTPERALPTEPPLDASAVLALAARLRGLHAAVDTARVTDDQRRRWQRRLGAIAEAGGSDLTRAEELLDRFTSELARHGVAPAEPHGGS